MKAICVSTEELNEMVTEAYGQECQVVFNDEKETEVVEWLNADMQVEKTTDFDSALSLIGTSMNLTIENYDCMDLGELGIGFALFF